MALSVDEFTEVCKGIFTTLDANGNGYIEKEECRMFADKLVQNAKNDQDPKIDEEKF